MLDLGHVLPQDPGGHILRGGRAAAPKELHKHQRLVDVAHAHPLGDELAQALEGVGGVWDPGVAGPGEPTHGGGQHDQQSGGLQLLDTVRG